MDPEYDGFLKMIRIDQNRIKAKILYARDLGSPVMTVAEMVQKIRGHCRALTPVTSMKTMSLLDI